jgi:cellobiose epimerase
VVGFLNAYQLSKDTKYIDAALRVWDFIANNLVDRDHGEWFWRVKPEGGVDESLPKVSEWKGPYHASRMCLETMHRLHTLSA